MKAYCLISAVLWLSVSASCKQEKKPSPGGLSSAPTPVNTTPTTGTGGSNPNNTGDANTSPVGNPTVTPETQAPSPLEPANDESEDSGGGSGSGWSEDQIQSFVDNCDVEIEGADISKDDEKDICRCLAINASEHWSFDEYFSDEDHVDELIDEKGAWDNCVEYVEEFALTKPRAGKVKTTKPASK
ncbi:MAG: hypothetical protein AB7T49_00225 [Oligoflexales bacterium]